MSYTAVDLGPTEEQMNALAHQIEVKLPHEHLHGDVTFHLTKAQLARLEKARASGRGLTLKLSKAQVKHHAQKGAGFFSNIARSVWNGVAKPALKAGANMAVNKGLDLAKQGAAHVAGKAVDMAGNKLKGLLGLAGSGLSPEHAHALLQIHQQHGSGFFGNLLKKLAHTGVDVVAGLAGGGLVPVHMRHLRDIEIQHGRGFFGNLLKGLGHSVIDAIGGGVNPLANPNEGLFGAFHQKKLRVPEEGSGLYF